MSAKTPNFGLTKPDITDVADITAMNKNWDILDDTVPLTRISSALSTNIKDYALTLERGFYAVHFSGASYTGTDLPEGNYKYGSAFIYVRLKGDAITIMLLGSESYAPQFAYCNGGNWSKWSTQCLPLSGGLISGNLDFKKVENGSATIYKNHSTTADYGLIIRDVASDGNYTQLLLSANDNTFKYRDKSGKTSNIAKIQNGSYEGTGNTQKSLSFNFVPKVVFVKEIFVKETPFGSGGYGRYGILIYGAPYGICASGTVNSPTHLTWNDHTLVWTADDVANALNTEGSTYNYIAVG